MKIYIAAGYSRRHEMREIKRRLEDHGHVVTSRWLEETHGESTGLSFVELTGNALRGRPHAEKDVADVASAEMLVMFTSPKSHGTGGRHTEFGYALAAGKRIAIVGPPENIFHCLQRVEWYNDLDHLIRSFIYNSATMSSGKTVPVYERDVI